MNTQLLKKILARWKSLSPRTFSAQDQRLGKSKKSAKKKSGISTSGSIRQEESMKALTLPNVTLEINTSKER